MTPIIQSILDNDVYKMTTQAFALEMYPDSQAQFRFQNRGKQRFNEEFLKALNEQVQAMSNLALTNDEYDFLKEKCPYLKRSYLEYLRNYRFNPDDVTLALTADNNLDIQVDGTWCDTTLWEVPLMAMISELYFKIIDRNWVLDGQRKLAEDKALKLIENSIKFAEFGTRRRRSFDVQEIVVKAFKYMERTRSKSLCFVGTSNLLLAMELGLLPIGSIPHEVIMGSSALESMNHPDYYAMDKWQKCFGSSLGTMLTDTYGIDFFLRSFNMRFANAFNSVRHDSGDPFVFTDKFIDHYKKLRIDPMTKTIIFSDNLNVDKVLRINEYCKDKIKCSFGIGTFFTNDFVNSPALNMVIKLYSMNSMPVVKLSDNPGKEMGDVKAVEIMKWIVENTLRRQ